MRVRKNRFLKKEINYDFRQKVFDNMEKIEKNGKVKFVKKPNRLFIKASWDELLYDLIFIIVIENI